MHFYIVGSRSGTPPSTAKFPCITVWKDNWDDYNFKTLHQVFYCKSDSSKELLGSTKILQKGEKTTSLPSHFTDLDSAIYASLGQNLDFYRKVRELSDADADNVLTALNDVVKSPALRDEIETESGFRNSLIRFTEAEAALRFGATVLAGHEPEKGHTFQYSCPLPGAAQPVDVSFDFDPDDELPGRINAIIGRNGVGKTQFLARLARDLGAADKKSAERRKDIDSLFTPSKPIFSRVIALSFSAFDKFTIPTPDRFFSYVYCGVRDKQGISRARVEARYNKYLERIEQQSRDPKLRSFAKLLAEHVADASAIADGIKAPVSDAEDVAGISSGQSILMQFLAAAVAYLQPGSLILFDEPEIHLHPNAVALLIDILNALLLEYDSFAIIATHSPVVIQEIPGKRVQHFLREGDVTVCSPLNHECFGENIAHLTRIVFETQEIPNFYKKTLRRLAKKRSLEEILELFDNNLSVQATAYAASLFPTSSKAEQ